LHHFPFLEIDRLEIETTSLISITPKIGILNEWN